MTQTEEVHHTDKTNFILNSASFHAPDYHREMAELVVPTIRPNEIVQAIDHGYKKWIHSAAQTPIIPTNHESQTILVPPSDHEKKRI
jgi:hypothetical protein